MNLFTAFSGWQWQGRRSAVGCVRPARRSDRTDRPFPCRCVRAVHRWRPRRSSTAGSASRWRAGCCRFPSSIRSAWKPKAAVQGQPDSAHAPISIALSVRSTPSVPVNVFMTIVLLYLTYNKYKSVVIFDSKRRFEWDFHEDY